jgi:hypothetical protein
MAVRRARRSGSWMAGGKFNKQRRNPLDPIPKYREQNGVAEMKNIRHNSERDKSIAGKAAEPQPASNDEARVDSYGVEVGK